MSADATSLAGKHAVVTGGGRGIGLGITMALLEAGARVSIVSRSTPPGGAYFCAQADVTNDSQLARAFDVCREEYGPIHVLVNNSGIADSAPLTRTSRAMWDRVIATNLTGPFVCTQRALPDMVSEKFGRILNVASIAGLYGAPYIAAYCASKHGVVGLTRATAMEYAGSNITANALCPGYTETDMLQHAVGNIIKFTGAGEDAARARLAAMNPEGRLATVDEVAAAAIALLSGTKTGVSLVIPGNTEA